MHRPVLLWPFMLALTFLFALSVTAPRTWEHVAQRTTLRPAVEGLHTPLRTAMPSLLVSDMATAAVAPRTANEFAPSYAPQPRKPTGESVGVFAPAPAAVNTVEPTAAPQLSGKPAIVIEPKHDSAPRFSTSPLLSPFVNSSPKVEPTSTPAVEVQGRVEATHVDVKPAITAPVEPTAPVVAAQPQQTTEAAPQFVAVVPSLNSPRLSGGPLRSVPSAPHPVKQPTPAPIALTPIAPTSIDSAPAIAAPQVAAPPVAVVAPIATPTQPTPSVVAPAVKSEVIATRPVQQPNKATVIESVAKPEATQPAIVQSWWPQPTDLVSRLEKLRGRPETRPWAERADGVLQQLSATVDPSAPEVVDLLDDLRTVAADPVVVDESRMDPAAAVELRLARHALLRRVDVWESLTTVLRRSRRGPQAVASDEHQSLEVCLVDLENQTAAAGETGRQWRNYLLVDSLRQMVRAGGPEERRAVAREVLTRMRRAGTTLDQNEFLRQGPFARLDGLLRGWADEEINPQRLLAGIERFEQGGLPSDGRALAEENRLLQFSSDESKKQLAVWLTSHYRNANVRVTVSSALLNRMLPDSLKAQTQVNETILGLPTRGWSTSRTGLSVKFLPSRDQLAVRLEAQGTVNAQTRTSSGAVRLFSHSNSTFAAQKDLLLSTSGIRVNPAVALSQNNTKLRGVESDYDNVPILGGIVASIASDRHAESRPAAQREAAWKMSRHVERSLDQDIEKHLQQVNSTLRDRVMSPLDQLKLTPEVVDLHTNDDRASVRLRIAGDDQLAAHTPRPRAYSDNVGSIQLHQSAINNVVDRLHLHGRSCTPAELYRHLVTQLGLPDQLDLSKLPPDVQFTFAKEDPLTIRLEEGKFELRIAVDELKCGERSWSNFVVRAQFKPEVINGQTYLVRDGVVRLNGPQLRTTSQISLRTVFAKVFPDDMQVALWPEQLRHDARFADLDIEQIDIRDGWLGVSVGPRHTAGVIPASTTTQR